MIASLPHMTSAELMDALDTLDIEQIELARLVDTSRTSVQRWSNEGAPGCVSLLLRLLLARPELKELIGARPRTGRGRPVKDRACRAGSVSGPEAGKGKGGRPGQDKA
jgi:hypothetical protein